jgi:replication factor A1
MSEVEKLIEKVVAESGKPEGEILAMMEKRKEATHGLLSDYGAIYAVAKEFGVGFGAEKPVVTGLADIVVKKAYNVAGRVKDVYPPKEFSRKDGSRGKFASIILFDNSAERRLILWDNNADLASSVSKGDVVYAKNVYGKNGLDQQVELHATSLSNIGVNPKEIGVKLPELAEKTVKIADLRKDLDSTDVLCRVSSYYPPAEFKRSDGSVGLRASFLAEDDSGRIRAVLWDEAAKAKLTNGDVVKIENAYLRENRNQELELHLGSRGRIIPSSERIELPPAKSEKSIKISEIGADAGTFSVIGRVVDVFKPKTYSKGRMASIIIGDGSGTIRAVLWDERSDIAAELKRGDAIKIRNAYSKPSLNNEPEVHVGRYGEVSINPDLPLPQVEELEKQLIKEKKIIELEDKDRRVKISGKIVDLNDRKRLMYLTCPYCDKKVESKETGYACEACGQEVDPVPNMVLTLTLEDDSGSIRAIAFKSNAEKILDLDVEEAMNMIGETQDESLPIRDAKERLLNQKITLIGRVRYSDFSDQLEFIVDEVA